MLGIVKRKSDGLVDRHRHRLGGRVGRVAAANGEGLDFDGCSSAKSPLQAGFSGRKASARPCLRRQRLFLGQVPHQLAGDHDKKLILIAEIIGMTSTTGLFSRYFHQAASFQGTKHLLNNGAAGAERVAADFPFFLANDQEQPV